MEAIIRKVTEGFGRREKGISTMAGVGVLTLIVAIAGIAAFYVLSPASSSSSCSSTIGPSSSSTPVSGIHVSMYSGGAKSSNAPGYRPDDIRLVIGINNTVTWTNDDSAAHTVTSTSAPSCASFDSGNMNSGASYTRAFTVPGTYQYDCKYHSWMTGTVVVVAGA